MPTARPPRCREESPPSESDLWNIRAAQQSRGGSVATYAKTSPTASPGDPATYVSPAIIRVKATDKKDTMASFSNYEATPVDLAAPGVNISSTTP